MELWGNLHTRGQHVLNFHLANFFLQKVHPHLFVIGIGLVPFPGILYFLDGIPTGLETNSVRNQSRKVPKKVSELVSKKIGHQKKEVSESVSVRFLCLVTRWLKCSKMYERLNA